MKKILLLTSLLLFVFSVSSFAQIRLPEDKKVLKKMPEKESPAAKPEYDCKRLDIKVEKKENKYEVVLNTAGPRPHHWDMIPLSEEEEAHIEVLTTRRNKISLSNKGAYLLNVMSASDDILCSTKVDLEESNARGVQGFGGWSWASPCSPGGIKVRANGQSYNRKQLYEIPGNRKPYCDVQVVGWNNKSIKVTKVAINGRRAVNNRKRVYSKIGSSVNVCVYYHCNKRTDKRQRVKCGRITIRQQICFL